jgi:anti-sigma factor RsiW
MQEDQQTIDIVHARVWHMLPWWVNGTLSQQDNERVERHVNQCAACAAEVELQRALQATLRSDPVMMAPQSGWQKMVERLDDDAATHDGKSPSIWWRGAVAVQTLLIVGLTTLLWQSYSSNSDANTAMLQPRYETLTANTMTPASDARGTVRVVFRKDVSLAEVNALLRSRSAQIVSGPSEAGVYTLAPSVSSDADTQLLDQLRKDERVIFAEPTLFK